jgi:GTPase SAR1 family protein
MASIRPPSIKSCRVVLLGAPGSGQASLIDRFVDDSFDEKKYNSETFYSKFKTHDVPHPPLNPKSPMLTAQPPEAVRLTLTAPLRRTDDRFAPRFDNTHSVNIVMIVYDITDRVSFDKVPDFLNQVARYYSDPQILLVGNKSDLESRRVVIFEELESLARKYNCNCIETSAKDGVNVKKAFESMVSSWLSKVSKANPNQQEVKSEEKPAITESEVVELAALETDLVRLNALVAEWVNSGNKLKDSRWSIIRNAALLKFQNERENNPSPLVSFNNIKEAINWPLFNVHRTGFFGDTKAVKILKMDLEKFKTQADLEKMRQGIIERSTPAKKGQ